MFLLRTLILNHNSIEFTAVQICRLFIPSRCKHPVPPQPGLSTPSPPGPPTQLLGWTPSRKAFWTLAFSSPRAGHLFFSALQDCCECCVCLPDGCLDLELTCDSSSYPQHHPQQRAHKPLLNGIEFEFRRHYRSWCG